MEGSQRTSSTAAPRPGREYFVPDDCLALLRGGLTGSEKHLGGQVASLQSRGSSAVADLERDVQKLGELQRIFAEQTDALSPKPGDPAQLELVPAAGSGAARGAAVPRDGTRIHADQPQPGQRVLYPSGETYPIVRVHSLAFDAKMGTAFAVDLEGDQTAFVFRTPAMLRADARAAYRVLGLSYDDEGNAPDDATLDGTEERDPSLLSMHAERIRRERESQASPESDSEAPEGAGPTLDGEPAEGLSSTDIEALAADGEPIEGEPLFGDAEDTTTDYGEGVDQSAGPSVEEIADMQERGTYDEGLSERPTTAEWGGLELRREPEPEPRDQPREEPAPSPTTRGRRKPR